MTLLALTLGVSEPWLMGYDVIPQRLDISTGVPLELLGIANIIPLPEMELKPVICQIACGTPILAQQNIEKYVEAPKSARCDFILKCKGDSMASTACDGDYVFIHSQPTVENGQIAVVLIGSEATLKRVFLYPGQIILQA